MILPWVVLLVWRCSPYWRQIRLLRSVTYCRVQRTTSMLVAGQHLYLAHRNARPRGCFGLEDEIKFWVKRGRGLDTEVRLREDPFHERFDAVLGDVTIECRPSRKESAPPGTGQGSPALHARLHPARRQDSPIRVLQIIRGKAAPPPSRSLAMDHAVFFRTEPAAGSTSTHRLRASHRLSARAFGEAWRHRRDHVIQDAETGLCRWIDFDFFMLLAEHVRLPQHRPGQHPGLLVGKGRKA